MDPRLCAVQLPRLPSDAAHRANHQIMPHRSGWCFYLLYGVAQVNSREGNTSERRLHVRSCLILDPVPVEPNTWRGHSRPGTRASPKSMYSGCHANVGGPYPLGLPLPASRMPRSLLTRQRGHEEEPLHSTRSCDRRHSLRHPQAGTWYRYQA